MDRLKMNKLNSIIDDERRLSSIIDDHTLMKMNMIM